MFFEFNQNNSGGRFTGPAHHVIIEADSATEANYLAVDVGLYFNGCEDGYDCECCGDRWSEQWEGGAKGDPVPSIYGTPIGQDKDFRDWCETDFCKVFYKDGRVETYHKAADIQKEGKSQEQIEAGAEKED